ncbi:tripartite tricarboxylate transporter TctB family protein [Fuscovulum ytuae]|uniref:Tripartite tricarboxylate transporter TctB family protein n=1 Tax=Fuscovulum ytuae TaxID=3042299 RepID=A0ABY8Q6X1_9RHOB|nr:tripartite tricarboxylate transporter TctB family protein [Fuscovulum sp. YMD61]WGV16035.1 tripartite tricarboxylate transporter TctB family protein [Fuscovulum sp. YMD61]
MPDHVNHIATIADADTDAFEDEVIPEASHLAMALFWAFALLALVVLPLATVPGKRDLGWVQEPWSWPFITLVVGLIGGFGPLRAYLRERRRPGFTAKANLAFEGMCRALIYAVGFLIYIGGVSVLGFTIASVIFMQALLYVSGLRGPRWIMIGLAVVAAIVLAFRVGLGIWFPLPPVMQLFPDWVGNSLGEYL